LPSFWESSQSLNLYTDTSNVGFGGYLGTKWFPQRWTENWLQFHTTVKEFFPIIVALEIWGDLLSNKRIQFHSDNIAVVYIINKKTSKDPVLMKLLRRLVVQLMKFNILFVAVHIPGMLSN